MQKNTTHALGRVELVAIAIGGMIGGGIFSILGVAAGAIGFATPFAIAIGGFLAFLSAYSYVQLSNYYKDEGATYSFFKKSFPHNKFAISYIGWLISFGYISTLALYAFTFSSYFCSLSPSLSSDFSHKTICAAIIIFFTTLNIISVKGMGKFEDFLVYIKVLILVIISFFLLLKGKYISPSEFVAQEHSLTNIIQVAALTFVAYEGFQLVIHAYNEVSHPDKNIPFAIYSSILIASILYIILSISALATIPIDLLIRDKEFALAAGATNTLGTSGYVLVMLGALLATSSAINGTLFGASRLMAVIASDGIFPKILAKRSSKQIPIYSLLIMATIAYLFILTGGLESIIEFGSLTFIFVSFLMAFTNFKLRKETKSHIVLTIFAMFFLALAALIILYYEIQHDMQQVYSILGVFFLLAILAKLKSKYYS